MDKPISAKTIVLTLGVLLICLSTAFYIVAWQEPGQPAPEENAATPLNTGTQPQSKAGRITATEFYDYNDANYYLNPSGQSNIKTICLGPICRDTWPETGGDTIQVNATAPNYWDAIQVCSYGTCCAPWRDCDSDGYTYSGMPGGYTPDFPFRYGKQDCDEGCNTCYSTSLAKTNQPDGKDQNCNGVVDEQTTDEFFCYGPDEEGYSYSSISMSGGDCNIVGDNNFCNNLCLKTGSIGGQSMSCSAQYCPWRQSPVSCYDTPFYAGADCHYCAGCTNTHIIKCQCKYYR